MSQQIEIEYKTLLTRKEFAKVKAYFGVTDKDFTWQKNTYFDTARSHLKKGHFSLRIRQWPTTAEQTIKVPQSIGKMELTDALTSREAQSLVDRKTVKNQGEVGKKLSSLNISPKQLAPFGTLTTYRCEKHLPIGIIAIDRSVYYHMTDYELELEVTDAVIGKQDFLALLKKIGIIEKPAKSKIQRMLMGKFAGSLIKIR